MKLSIIMPFAVEYPQAIFTILSIWFELRYSNIDYELIAVNNWCVQASKQVVRRDTCPSCKNVKIITRKDLGEQLWRKDDICGDKVKSYAAIHKWLKYVEYTDKLSHWQAKNAGVQVASGDVLFFIDAHCGISPGTLRAMYNYYINNIEELNGTLHLPLAYMLENTANAKFR